MGKYTLTRTMNKDRERSRNNPDATTFTGTSNYFTDVPDNEAQFRVQSFLYGADPTGLYRGFIEQRDLANYWNDYFKNTGLSWSDIKYPSMMRGFGSTGSYSRTVYRFSKNILHLY